MPRAPALALAVALTPLARPALAQTSRAAGDWMCPCGGGVNKPLGGASSCEAACFGGETIAAPPSPAAAVTQMAGDLLGKFILQSLQGDPAAEAREQARQAAWRAEMERVRVQQERDLEETKRRLLGTMKGVGPETELSLKGVDSGHDLRVKTDGAVSGLQLKTGDDDGGQAAVARPFGTGAPDAASLDDDAIPVDAETPPMLARVSAPDFPSSWGLPEEVHGSLALKDSLCPAAAKFIGDAARGYAQTTWDKLQPGLKEAFAAEFSGGIILYNEYKLPDYVGAKVIAASQGDLSLGQARLADLGGANVLYNFGTAPNAALAKITDAGELRAGAIAYVTDVSSAKVQDALDEFEKRANKEIRQGITSWVVLTYSKNHFPGGRSIKDFGGAYSYIGVKQANKFNQQDIGSKASHVTNAVSQVDPKKLEAASEWLWAAAR